MPRAKPKKGLPAFAVQPVKFSKKDQERILEDCSFPRRYPESDREELFVQLQRVIGIYNGILKTAETTSTAASIRAELRPLIPSLRAMEMQIRNLSEGARRAIRLAIPETRAENNEKVIADDPAMASEDRRAAEALDRALEQLGFELTMVRRSAELALPILEHRMVRHRSPSTLKPLLDDLRRVFSRFDRDEHTDEDEQKTACETFVKHVLEAASIPHPSRLDDLTPNT